MPVRLCVSAGTDLAHRYREYFLPTCVHCVTNSTNLSYMWGKMETFLHLSFHRHMAFWIDTSLCAAVGRLPTLQIATQNFPVKRKVKAGATFFINCKLFHSSCEFASFIPVSVTTGQCAGGIAKYRFSKREKLNDCNYTNSSLQETLA